MRRIIDKMYFEIESCENRLEEEADPTVKIQLKERKKTIKEFLHQIEAEVNYDNESLKEFFS